MAIDVDRMAAAVCQGGVGTEGGGGVSSTGGGGGWWLIPG